MLNQALRLSEILKVRYIQTRHEIQTLSCLQLPIKIRMMNDSVRSNNAD